MFLYIFLHFIPVGVTGQRNQGVLFVFASRIGAPLTLQFGQDLSSYHEPGNEQGWSVPLDVHFAYTAPNSWTLAENLPQGLFCS